MEENAYQAWRRYASVLSFRKSSPPPEFLPARWGHVLKYHELRPQPEIRFLKSNEVLFTLQQSGKTKQTREGDISDIFNRHTK